MKESVYIIEDICDFYPEHIFECGQCFRWKKEEDGSYTGIAGGHILNVKLETAGGLQPCALSTQTGDKGSPVCRLVLNHCSREAFNSFWKSYFDLERDYGKIKKTLAQDDPVMEKAVKFGWGIRILKQDLWETILSFIISQNNHIPRIKGCIERLAALYGEAAGEYRGRVWYNLPSPQKLASLTAEDLAPIRLGYRTRYVIETARQICSNGFPQSPRDLSALCGVGPKVAGCIALFAMDHHESFPVDVWVARVMHEFYGLDEKDKGSIAEFAEAHFGELGGFAQQYLFYYIRENFTKNT